MYSNCLATSKRGILWLLKDPLKTPWKKSYLKKTLKTSIQTLYDRGLFDIFDHAHLVLINYLFTGEVYNKRRLDLGELYDDENVIQSFC